MQFLPLSNKWGVLALACKNLQGTPPRISPTGIFHGVHHPVYFTRLPHSKYFAQRGECHNKRHNMWHFICPRHLILCAAIAQFPHFALRLTWQRTPRLTEHVTRPFCAAYLPRPAARARPGRYDLITAKPQPQKVSIFECKECPAMLSKIPLWRRQNFPPFFLFI